MKKPEKFPNSLCCLIAAILMLASLPLYPILFDIHGSLIGVWVLVCWLAALPIGLRVNRWIHH